MRRRQGKVVIADSRIRGFTGCVLMRTQAVVNIKIPSHLHTYEDWYIKRSIEEKGYKWLIIKDLGFTHFHRGGKPRDSYQDAYIAAALGFLSLKGTLRRSITTLPKVIFALYVRPNFKMASWQIKSQLYTLVCCLKCKLRS